MWADVFASARLQVHLVGPLYAMADAELVLPLTQYQFAFDPSTPVYEIPVAAGAGLAGLFVQIP